MRVSCLAREQNTVTPGPALCPGSVSDSTVDLMPAKYLFCLFSACTSSVLQINFQVIKSATQLGLVGFQFYSYPLWLFKNLRQKIQCLCVSINTLTVTVLYLKIK